MRINKFLAQATGLSRRTADAAIQAERVNIDGQVANLGTSITDDSEVTLDGMVINKLVSHTLIILNKPWGYVCSRAGQGSRTIYELLPAEYHSLKPVGRLDKDSSGLILLTDDGDLANKLTHPSYGKSKAYQVQLDKALSERDCQQIKAGIELEDGLSRLQLAPLDSNNQQWQVTMSEGRNRQIRRTFAALGYEVTKLHRTNFGDYELDGLTAGKYQVLG